MKDEIQFSDEFLNAYIDDELSQSDKSRLLAAARKNEQLNRRLCQLQRVRNMVQLAYHDVNLPLDDQPVPQRNNSFHPRLATAASILLLVGALAGWFTHNHFADKRGLTELVKELRTNNPHTTDPWKLMVQVSTNDQHRFAVLMDETERLLKAAQAKNENVVIQILANSEGINLLKDDQSAMSLRVRGLNRQYNNLLLTACGQTLKKLKLKNQRVPRLLNEAMVVPSALQEVIEKQKQGWTYVRI